MAATFKKGGTAKSESKAEGRSIVLYGPPFSGKTSTLQYDPSIRVFLCDMDKNSGVLNRVGNVDIYGIDTYEDYLQVLKGITEGSMMIDGEKIIMDYDLYAIDSFTRFEELLKSWITRVYAPARKREIKEKFGAQTDWADLQDEEVRQVRAWQALTRRTDKPINVLWIGHDMESVNSSEFDKVLQLRLQGKYAAPGIMGAVDAVFYMVKQTNEKTGNVGYGILTMDEGAARAEARLAIQDRKEMPKYIWFPKWGEVFTTIGATNLKGGE